MGELTHTTDPIDGHATQIVTPRRLRAILDAQGNDYSRPDGFGPDDEWDCGEQDVSRTAAALGRLGGKAGRGASQVRGDSDHYRAIRAKRTAKLAKVADDVTALFAAEFPDASLAEITQGKWLAEAWTVDYPAGTPSYAVYEHAVLAAVLRRNPDAR